MIWIGFINIIPYFVINFWPIVVFPDKESPINDIFKGICKGKFAFYGEFALGYALSIIYYKTDDNLRGLLIYFFNCQSPMLQMNSFALFE